MTRSNSRPPVDLATLLAAGKRVIDFLPDPAFHKPWREAAARCSRVPDSIAETTRTISAAATSVTEAGRETAAAWRRHGRNKS